MTATSTELQAVDPNRATATQFARLVIQRLAHLLKVATMHQLGNEAVRPAFAAWLNLVNPRLRLGEEVSVQILDESVYVNHEPVRLDNASWESGEALREVFKRLGIQEISFQETVTDSSLRDFLTSFQTHYAGDSPTQFREERFPAIGLRTLENVARRDAAAAPGQRLLYAYAQFMAVMERTVSFLEARREPRLSRVRRAFQLLVDATPEDQEALLIALTRLPRTSNGTSLHLTAAAALTLLVARRLGLSRPAMVEAGLAAAFHDIARNRVSTDAGAKTVDQIAARIPLETMLKLTPWSNAPIMLRCATVAYEHRLPVSTARPSPTVLARLVGVPCAYDLLLNPPPPRAPLSPASALSVIRGGEGVRFDPLVVRAFASVVGMYPPGTFVMLTNGYLAMVVARPSQAEIARVTVRVLVTGRPYPPDPIVDLGDPAQNPDRVGVASVVPTASVGLNVLECLFLDAGASGSPPR